MVSPLTLVLGTGNPGKVAEFRRLLDSGGWRPADRSQFRDLPPVAEVGASFGENARLKAVQIAQHVNHWTLADDTGLEVVALNGEPGIHSSRFAGPGANAEANRRHLLQRLRDVPLEDRSARFVCHLALADPTGSVRAEATGYCAGRIQFSPRGMNLFGYDSLFEIVEYHRTLAELGDAATGCLSHRARAVGRLWPELTRLVKR